MDVQTKDGILLRGVPDGTPDSEIKARIDKIRASNAPDNARQSPITPVKPTPGMDPTADMGTGQRLLAGAGKAVVDLGRGAAQLFGADNQGAIDEAKRLDKPLMDTPAGFLGNVGGNVAATLPAMLIPAVNGIVGGAMMGAGLGAAQPVATGEQPRGANVALGAVAGGAMPAVGAVARSVKSLAEPLYEGGRNTIMGRLLNRVTGDNSQAVQQRLATARALVPGSNPTAAEVAESGGVSALQRMAAQADPEAYAQRGMEQASARATALRGIAKDPAALDEAVKARAGASRPLYETAAGRTVPADRELETLLNRPSLEAAMSRAQKLAREAGESISFPAKDATATQSRILDASGKPAFTATTEAAPAQHTGRGLQYLKMALDDMIDNPQTSGIGTHELNALRDTRSGLVRWLDKSIPEYGQANAAFRAGSRPINQMQIGQELEQRIAPALADHGALARETGNRYAQALRNSEQTARTATGFGRNALESVMEPEQMSTINSVAQDLARKSNAQDLGRGAGSNTFQNFAMGNIAQQSGMPAVTNFALNLPGVHRATAWAYRNSDEQMREALAKALLNPQASADLMKNAAGNPAIVRALREAQRAAIPVSTGAALSYSQ